MKDDIDAPPTPVTPIGPDTLTGVTALARFEFEEGRGNEGTKVVMVEWHADRSRQLKGSWHISWAGKRTVFPADDRPSDQIRRSYFLIPPNAAIPPHITLSYQCTTGRSINDETTEPLAMTVKPLPAIFTPELGATAKASGKKGVLHTLWAKKRLHCLEQEIQREREHNLEGIALEMATAERDWIQHNFGLQAKPPATDVNSVNCSEAPATVNTSVMSSRSPMNQRLSQRLKGLSLGTTEKDLAGRVNTPTRELHPLSPEVSDIAYSSFGTFRTGPASPQSASMAQKRVVAHAPPASVVKQQSRDESSPSLNFIQCKPTIPQDIASVDTDDLFAIALSPRSPDLVKSPFSFSSAEVSQANTLKDR